MPTFIKKYNYTVDYQKITLKTLSHSYFSFFVGIVVIITTSFLINYYYQKNFSLQSGFFTKKVTVADKKNSSPLIYQVKEGDDLWQIAEKFYGSGFNTKDIAQINHLADPNSIQTGQILVIPSVAAKKNTISGQISSLASGEVKFKGDRYIVKEGDSLWQIAVDCYGDGYSWVKIAKENNLVSADAIYTGLILKIPR
jgi:nucleoid-associated protein YgaU